VIHCPLFKNADFDVPTKKDLAGENGCKLYVRGNCNATIRKNTGVCVAEEAKDEVGRNGR
jgi:hypothetical protein